jgi:hypothetical protein
MKVLKMCQITHVGENVETPYNSSNFDTSANQISNTLYEKTPCVVVEQNHVFDSIETINFFEKTSKDFYDKTPNTISEENNKFILMTLSSVPIGNVLGLYLI